MPVASNTEIPGAASALVPAGVILMWGGTSAPSGYVLCDGTSYLRTTYPALFLAIGTTFGSADGTHFTVPDLRGRFPIGKAAAGTGSTLGGTGGTIDHVHAAGDIVAANESTHTHQADPPAATTSGPSATAATSPIAGTTATDTHTHNVDIPAFTTGAGAAHTHALSGNSATSNPPFQAVNYIISAT